MLDVEELIALRGGMKGVNEDDERRLNRSVSSLILMRGISTDDPLDVSPPTTIEGFDNSLRHEKDVLGLENVGSREEDDEDEEDDDDDDNGDDGNDEEDEEEDEEEDDEGVSIFLRTVTRSLRTMQSNESSTFCSNNLTLIKSPYWYSSPTLLGQ